MKKKKILKKKTKNKTLHLGFIFRYSDLRGLGRIFSLPPSISSFLKFPKEFWCTCREESQWSGASASYALSSTRITGGLAKLKCLGPTPQVSESVVLEQGLEFTSLASSLVMLMLLFWGFHLEQEREENRCVCRWDVVNIVWRRKWNTHSKVETCSLRSGMKWNWESVFPKTLSVILLKVRGMAES